MALKIRFKRTDLDFDATTGAASKRYEGSPPTYLIEALVKPEKSETVQRVKLGSLEMSPNQLATFLSCSFGKEQQVDSVGSIVVDMPDIHILSRDELKKFMSSVTKEVASKFDTKGRKPKAQKVELEGKPELAVLEGVTPPKV